MGGIFRSPWLGTKRGYLADWITQKWVEVTGRFIDLGEETWISGPIGKTSGIGSDYFHELARTEGLELESSRPSAGLVQGLSSLFSNENASVQAGVVSFYEKTSDFEIDVWSEWASAFKPFGHLLALVFSRRLQQLNVPLSPLDTRLGMTSEILQLVDPESKVIRYTAWLRHLPGTGNVLYAGTYSLCNVPGLNRKCVKVVFPLPNGNAIVFMEPTINDDGSLLLRSSGNRFGEAGFYFVVHSGLGRARARYIRSFQETIHVFESDDSEVRADHVLRFFGFSFLRLHYRMRPRQ